MQVRLLLNCFFVSVLSLQGTVMTHEGNKLCLNGLYYKRRDVIDGIPTPGAKPWKVVDLNDPNAVDGQRVFAIQQGNPESQVHCSFFYPDGSALAYAISDDDLVAVLPEKTVKIGKVYYSRKDMENGIPAPGAVQWRITDIDRKKKGRNTYAVKIFDTGGSQSRVYYPNGRVHLDREHEEDLIEFIPENQTLLKDLTNVTMDGIYYRRKDFENGVVKETAKPYRVFATDLVGPFCVAAYHYDSIIDGTAEVNLFLSNGQFSLQAYTT